MADHVQEQILEGVRDALLAAGTGAGTRVFLDRVDRLTAAELPAILVAEAPDGEQVDPQTVSGLEQRQYAVQVQCVVRDGTGYARACRELGRQVEVVLGAPRFPVPKPGRARLRASRIALSGEGDLEMASREQTWLFTYSTRRGQPDVAL